MKKYIVLLMIVSIMSYGRVEAMDHILNQFSHVLGGSGLSFGSTLAPAHTGAAPSYASTAAGGAGGVTGTFTTPHSGSLTDALAASAQVQAAAENPDAQLQKLRLELGKKATALTSALSPLAYLKISLNSTSEIDFNQAAGIISDQVNRVETTTSYEELYKLEKLIESLLSTAQKAFFAKLPLRPYPGTSTYNSTGGLQHYTLSEEGTQLLRNGSTATTGTVDVISLNFEGTFQSLQEPSNKIWLHLSPNSALSVSSAYVDVASNIAGAKELNAAKKLSELFPIITKMKLLLAEKRAEMILQMEATTHTAAQHALLGQAKATEQLVVIEAQRKAKELADKAAEDLQAATAAARQTELELEAANKAAADAAALLHTKEKAAADAAAQVKVLEANAPHLLKQQEAAHNAALAQKHLEEQNKLAQTKATLATTSEQQKTAQAARAKLVRNTLMGLTGAGLLGMAAYFGLRHYYMPRPTIIERTDTSMLGPIEKLRGFKVPASNLDSVVLSPDLQKKVLDKFLDLTEAIKNRMPLSNMMFYGPAGTGKTMAAQAFCRRLHEQKLANHVIIRGPAFKRLGSASKAQEALADILRWANQSKLPVVLVFDEAEALFADRASEFANEMTNDLVTTMLSFFERAISDKMMFIFSTNYPNRIDKALLNRIDPSNIIRFTPPGEDEIKMLLDSYLQQHILDRKFGVSPEISNKKSQLAQKMNGLVGRQIDSLIAQTLYKMIGRKRQELDLQTLEDAIADATRKQDYSAY